MSRKYHLCNYPTCHTLVQYPDYYCLQHKQNRNNNKYSSIRVNNSEKEKQYNKNRYANRNKKFTQFYKSTAWRKTREYIIARANGLCEYSLAKGVVKPGKIVDHKIPLRTHYGWQHRLDVNNLQYLSQEEHTRKTEWEKKHIQELYQKYGREI